MTILFIGPLKAEFVKNDISILSEKHKLILHDTTIGRGFIAIFNLFFSGIIACIKSLRADIIYCWFADYTTPIPTIFGRITGKKVYVVAGGFDVGYLKELNYGAWAIPFRRFCVKNTFRFATKIFPVSEHADKELKERMTGYMVPSEVIYNCVNIQKFKDYFEPEENKNTILTVSRAEDYTEYKLKGSDKFIQIASQLPEYNFVLAGLQGEAYKLATKEGEHLTNLTIIPGWLNLFNELVPLYKQASIYCQLSLEETFCISVVEAMLFGCVPIVANRAALPEIVGDDRFIAENDEAMPELIKKYYSYLNDERHRIIVMAEKFDIIVRAEKLLKYFP
ncbi:MAG: glycosyltransferase family 4 protein [FCB group bacterium]